MAITSSTSPPCSLRGLLINEAGGQVVQHTWCKPGMSPIVGPTVEKFLDHLDRLKRQALKKGGRIHTLLGNHETMNYSGDLRYVHPGEYQAFESSGSAALQDRYYQVNVDAIKNRLPEEEWPVFDAAYRARFNERYPPGYVEHRRAWNEGGQYGDWVLSNPVAVVVNDSLFLHGGISCKHNADSLQTLTDGVHAELAMAQLPADGLVIGADGPLWYRGLASAPEAEEADNLAAIRENFLVSRVVVGHTPTPGVVTPRFDGAVVIVDTGISRHYGGYSSYLEILPDGVWAGYGDQKIRLPEAGSDALNQYFEQVAALYPDDPALQQSILEMQQFEVEPLSPAVGDEL